MEDCTFNTQKSQASEYVLSALSDLGKLGLGYVLVFGCEIHRAIPPQTEPQRQFEPASILSCAAAMTPSFSCVQIPRLHSAVPSPASRATPTPRR